MLDSLSPTSRKEGKYLYGQNIYPLDPTLAEGIVGRPGIVQLGTTLTGRVQGIFQFTKQSGTEFTVIICGGKFYTYNWSTAVYTEVLSTAQLTAAAITLNATADISFLTFSDKVVISDGVNTAWMWDGTTGAGLTKLTNAPVFYGQVWAYGGRIFGIKAAEPDTIVWSLVDTPNTGYEAGGYNNSWSITQTDPNRLYAIPTTNDAIYVVRGRSGTMVTGTVTSNFTSAATRDALSDTTGTMSPFATLFHDVNLIVLDADLHPQLLQPGGTGFVPLWAPFRETLKDIPKTAALKAKCRAVNYTPAQLGILSVPAVDATEPNMMLVYDLKNPMPIPVAVWLGMGNICTMAMVKNATGQPYLLHGDDAGHVYLHGNPEDDSPWDDFLVSGTAAVEHILELQALGYSTKTEKVWDRIDIAIRAFSRMTLEVKVITPRGETAAQTVVVDSGIIGWDTGIWDQATFDPDVSLTTQEAHDDVGIDVTARWIKPHFRHATIGERFGIVAVSVLGYANNDDPEVP